jgi:uncharacterized protein YlxW (UPF0749 family)
VTGGSHARPPESEAPSDPEASPRRLPRLPFRVEGRRAGSVWRIGTPVVVLLCGALFVVSAANSDGTDLRPGRYTDLASLVKDEADQYDALRQQVSDLDSQVQALSASMSDRDVNRYHRKIAELKDPAGLEPRSGPGVTITLSDAPEDVINSSTGNLNLLVVHQQDIQAVANALWAGGAEAMTIQGQRVVSTTGIRCVGNSVVLNDVPYAPPYRISAIGPTADMLDAVNASPFVDLYLQYVDAYQLGWDVQVESNIDMPGFAGSTGLRYARAAGVLANADGG